MFNEAILKEYDRLLPCFDGLASAARERIEQSLINFGIKFQSVSARVKDRTSLAGKIARPDRIYTKIEDVTDIVGVRVITYFEDHVGQVAALLENIFDVDLQRSTDKKLALDSTQFGYRSLHYICRFREDPGSDLPCLLPDCYFEVQLCSVVQHAWAEVEHDLGYKYEVNLPRHIRRKFSRLAGILELVDEEFVEIRNYLESYQAKVAVQIEGAAELVTLDSVSLETFIDTNAPLQELDAKLAKLLGRDLADQTFFPDYLLRILDYLQVTSIAHLQRLLEVHEREVLDIAGPYFRFTEDVWKFGARHLDCIMRGYGIFLLGHLLMFSRHELKLEKIEEATRFFYALDYPDRPQEARRVATAFVTHFSHWGNGS